MEYSRFEQENTLAAIRAILSSIAADPNDPSYPSIAPEDDIEELALSYEDWNVLLAKVFGDRPGVRTRALLTSLDSYLDVISGPENERLWSEEAVREELVWSDVRWLAGKALESLSDLAPTEG